MPVPVLQLRYIAAAVQQAFDEVPAIGCNADDGRAHPNGTDCTVLDSDLAVVLGRMNVQMDKEVSQMKRHTHALQRQEVLLQTCHTHPHLHPCPCPKQFENSKHQAFRRLRPFYVGTMWGLKVGSDVNAASHPTTATTSTTGPAAAPPTTTTTTTTTTGTTAAAAAAAGDSVAGVGSRVRISIAAITVELLRPALDARSSQFRDDAAAGVRLGLAKAQASRLEMTYSIALAGVKVSAILGRTTMVDVKVHTCTHTHTHIYIYIYIHV
jgi:hypothetical protein